MSSFKLSRLRLADLRDALGSLPPNDIGDLKSIRKLNKALDCIEEVNKDYINSLDALRKEAFDSIKDERAELTELQKAGQGLEGKAKKDNEDKHKKLENVANAKLSTYNEKLLAYQMENGKEVVEVEMDGNYQTELKEQFKKHGAKLFLQQKPYLEVAEGLGIEE